MASVSYRASFFSVLRFLQVQVSVHGRGRGVHVYMGCVRACVYVCVRARACVRVCVCLHTAQASMCMSLHACRSKKYIIL